ncbi:MAG: hypothetical protein H7330_01040, partial [Hymenobacteraceae bacterium]|nr:hypothetical protein [Hymenobacteraceae bacterium]
MTATTPALRLHLPRFLLLLLIGGGGGGAQGQTPGSSAQPAISAATIERVLTTLAADSLLGRAPGTPGAAKAARFLAAEFARLGLQPYPGA